MKSFTEHIRELYWKLRWSSRATSFLHFLAMNMPFNSWRIFFHKLRGARIGRNVYIVQTAFLEESRPWLLTIEDDVRIGAGCLIFTHDAVFCQYIEGMPNRYAPVVLKKKASICSGSVILPGITVGEGAVVSAQSLVTKNVPAGMIVAGVPARVVCPVSAACRLRSGKAEKYREYEQQTRYPWRMRNEKSETA